LKTDGTWALFSAASDGVRSLTEGPRYLGLFKDWAVQGVSAPLAVVRSGIVALPLLAIVQIGQYLRYLEAHGLSHQQFLAHVGRFGGGLQGYCGGLPAAVAIACAKDEAEVVRHMATILRILVGVGAYAEAADDTRDVDGSTTLALRLKYEGQGEDLTSRFPGTHVSAITEPRSISIVGSAGTLDQLYRFARDQGLQVQKMEVRGKVHNPDNAQLAADLCRICHETPSLQLPEAAMLQVPVRSNRTALTLQHGSMTEEIVTTILASRCEWFSLLSEVAQDLKRSAQTEHSVVFFGLTDCVPLSPFHKQSLRINKIEAHSLIHVQRDGDIVNKRRSAMQPPPELPEDAIAIIGASCRLPGANDLDELWDLISQGLDCHREVPTDRFDLPGSFRASQTPNFAHSRKFYGNFLDDIKRFDNTFFKISAREAASMDPQQRMLLELSHEALESAGYLSTHSREQGDNVGCFIGASFVEYLDNTSAHAPTAFTSTGTIRAFLCGRISYQYGWSGPAEVLDTACSSSLVAIHRACRAVQGRECRMALAGGINLITGVHNYLDLAKAGFLSPTGQCKPFDAAADGYCRSDGAGLVVLKRLRDAIADGDQVMGVISGAATNQGGRSCSITVPQPSAQQALYRTVLERAGVRPEHVTYVEAHGTGTQAGDPLEMESIRAVLAGRDSSDTRGALIRKDTLTVGSIKGNIGHCETAAGVAGLLKVLAMLKHGKIPPQASHSRLNPKIPPLEPDGITIARSLQGWDVPFRAALVSSYGAAGSNCAVLCCGMEPAQGQNVVEWGGMKEKKSRYPGVGYAQPYSTTTYPSDSLCFPLHVSAASEQSLQENARKLAAYLRRTAGQVSLLNVAYTLNEKRQRFKYLVSITASTVQEAAAQLDNIAKSPGPDTPSAFQLPATTKPSVLVFSGQTDRAVGLDRSYYFSYPIFRAYIDACDHELTELGYKPIIPSIFQTKEEPINDISTLQCGVFAVQYACARSWMDAGLRPKALVGHSLGELTALAVSGVLSLRDALKLVAERGRLVETKWGAEKGAMLALQGCEVEGFYRISRLVLERGHKLEIACYNGPTSLVAVGTSAAVAAAEETFRKEPSLSGIRFQRLATSHGFHSALVDPILPDLAAVGASLTWHEPAIPLYTCTAEPLGSVKEGYDVCRHAREPVFFSEAVQRVEDALGPCVWLEAGIDSPVINMARRAAKEPDAHTFQAMKTPTKGSSVPANAVGEVVASLWRSGVFLSHWRFLPVRNDNNLPGARECKQIWLPPYQFQRTPHWLDNIDRAAEAFKTAAVASAPETKPPPPPPLISRKPSISNSQQGVAEFTINTQSPRFQELVAGHAVRSRPLCPASVYAECATMAAQQLPPAPGSQGTQVGMGLVLEQVRFLSPLGASPQGGGEVTLRLEQTNSLGSGDGSSRAWTFSVSTHQQQQPKSKPIVHATGRISLPSSPTSSTSELTTLARLLTTSLSNLSTSPDADRLQSTRAYTLFSRVVTYAPFFRGMRCVTLLDKTGEAAATVALPPGVPQPGREDGSPQAAWRTCDSVLVDAWIQVAGLLVNSNDDNEGEVAVMTGLDRAVISPDACSSSNGDEGKGEREMKVYVKVDGDGSNGDGAGRGEIVGDVVVFDSKSEGRQGSRVVAALCGCRFARVPVAKLEMMLDLAGSGSGGSMMNSRVKDAAAATADGTSLSTPTEASASSFNPTPASTLTPAEPGSAEHSYATLREMIAGYTGLDSSAVPASTALSDIGLDSLASVELAEQLSSVFGVSVDSSDLPASTLDDLARRLGHSPSAGGEQHAMSRESSPFPPALRKDTVPSLDLAGDRAKLLRILSELSGAKAEDITPQHALVDLGIDSLSLVELQEELRSSFSADLGGVDASCTVQDLMTQLGIAGPPTSQRSTEPDASKFSPDASTVSENDTACHQEGKITLGNPFVALESSDGCFNSSATIRGFKNYWRDVAPLQDELTVAYIIEAFSALGVSFRHIPPGARLPSLSNSVLADKYGKLLARLWEILQQRDIVSVDSEGRRIRGPAYIDDCIRRIDDLRVSLVNPYYEYIPEANLINLTGPRLADCLTGNADPVQIMFGSATSLQIMETYYSQSPMLSTATQQLAIFLTAYLKDADTRGRPIRILEVGAGTGGTTRWLTEALQIANIPVQYTFTDISPSLVSKAKAKFAQQHPWIDFVVLDLEKPIPAQFKHRFDVVIGTNCVHATTDRAATCQRLRDTLVVSGGVLVLSEVTRVVDWYDIAFGLLDGWWVADQGRRYPLQPAEYWMDAFRKAGFASASYSRGDTPEANTQRLLVACTKGWPCSYAGTYDTEIARPLAGAGKTNKMAYRLLTMVYKEVNGVKIHADVYFPSEPTGKAMPIGNVP
jgi:acyl transferase domain-containing protein/SAM-dependent methyltransferase/aryl carrier-like protein